MALARTLDPDSCYEAMSSRDSRFDGMFYTAVKTTGIYCRPSCSARTPARHNVIFHRSAASAQAAGFRACKKCSPDATPGSPDWDVAADAAGRAMRLIADGIVDREGVEGLAGRVGYTSRHLTRVLTDELGAGPLALARARRAQTARTLIESTAMAFVDVAFAAGFSSVRQFNDTIREVYAAAPRDLRGRRGAANATGTLDLRLAVRTPYAGDALFRFLASRAIPGVESVDVESVGAVERAAYSRTLRLPHGSGVVRLVMPHEATMRDTAFVRARFRLTDLRDTAAAVERVRRLLDADCDPVAVAESLAADPVLAGDIVGTPGLRVPGHVDGNEIAVRAVLGQQVSVAAARTLAGRLTAEHGELVDPAAGSAVPPGESVPGPTRLFPSVEVLAGLDPSGLPMPSARGRALVGLCTALASGDLTLDRGADREEVRRGLLALPGIGPWTADYVSMRALGHPDVFLTTDLGVRHALAAKGIAPGSAASVAERWSPWRSYALMYLWNSLTIDPESATLERI
ncbi:MAG: DNA-3-methyladenine glycosylase 2 family protein [Nocardioides sp.]